jgi:hypothetical protein
MKKLLLMLVSFITSIFDNFGDIVGNEIGGVTVLATQYQDVALDLMIQDTLTAPFIIPSNELVEWFGAKTFKFFGVKTPGMRNYGRDASGIGGANITQVDNFEQAFTLSHERYVNMYLDKGDVDETGGVINSDLIVENFIREQWNPEIDAYFFSTVATQAIALGAVTATDVAGTITSATVYAYLKAIISRTTGGAKLRRYRQAGRLIQYVTSEIMDLLEQATNFQRKIEVMKVMPGGKMLETRVTGYDGIVVIEVIDDERFYTAFDFAPTDAYLSFEAAVGSYKLNVLTAAVGMTRTVPKFNDIYIYEPGEVQGVNGYVVDIFPYWDTFIFKNNKGGGVIDHIAIDRDTTAVV